MFTRNVGQVKSPPEALKLQVDRIFVYHSDFNFILTIIIKCILSNRFTKFHCP